MSKSKLIQHCDAIFIAYLVLIVLGTCFNINTAYEIVWLGYPATTLQLVVAIVTFLASLHICIMGDGIEQTIRDINNRR